MLSRTDIYTVNDAGKLKLHLHRGQTEAWDSERRFIFVIAGTQGGKTSFGPWWLWREIEDRGEGDYLVVTATYDLFKLKLLPEMQRVFGGVLPGWEYVKIDKTIYSEDRKTRIILRSADAEGGLESATAKAAWLDECGQDKFKLSAWEAVQRRLSLAQGRTLGTTTPYNVGWLKTEVFDRWTAGDDDYHVIQFKSIMNPAFPEEEYHRAKDTLPAWKFAMFYNGEFSRPAGMIYDTFDTDKHIIPPFAIPAHWPRYGGLDFGGVNTAAVCYAKNPNTGAYYAIKEYHEGGKTSAEHAEVLKRWGCRVWVGGAKSEGQWRMEFSAAGLPIAPPAVSDVEVGIDRVYGCHKGDRLFVFDTLTRYKDEKGRYTRELDQSGQPTEKIKDKNDYHIMDAERYIIGMLEAGTSEMPAEQPGQKSKFSEHDIDEGSRWKRY